MSAYGELARYYDGLTRDVDYPMGGLVPEVVPAQ